jgi:hypothetical protein
LAVVQLRRVLANPSTDIDTLLAIAAEYPSVMNAVLEHPSLRDSRDELTSRVMKGESYEAPAARLAFGIAIAADFEPALMLLLKLHKRYGWFLAHRPPGAWAADPGATIGRWLGSVADQARLDGPVAEIVLSSPFFDHEHAQRAFEVLSQVCPDPFDIHPRVSALIRHHPNAAVRKTLRHLPGLSVHIPA